MNEFLLSCKSIVLNNVNCSISEEVIDVLTIAVMALVLSHKEIALEKLPKILQELDIYAEDKSVLEISHEKLNNYMEDESLSHSDAAVTRSLKIDDSSNKVVGEKRTLIMSLSALHKNGPIDMIEKVIHELLHLMRFGGIDDQEKNIVIKDGIGTARFNKGSSTVRRKHYNLEEGIVQFYTLEALNSLYQFIESENVSSNKFLADFKRKYKSYDFNCYKLQVIILEQLCNNSKFRQLLDYTFEEDTTPSQLALYFNEVMGSGSAFTSFSRQIDLLTESAISGNDSISERIAIEIKKEIYLFNTKARIKK